MLGYEKNGKDVACLYAPHEMKEIKQYIRDFTVCPEKDKEKYLYQQELLETRKRGRGRGKTQRVTVSAADTKVKSTPAESSILFTTIFGGKYRDQISTDNGVNSNGIDKKMSRRISAARVGLKYSPSPILAFPVWLQQILMVHVQNWFAQTQSSSTQSCTYVMDLLWGLGTWNAW